MPRKNQVALNPVNTVFDAKRLIGRKITDTTVQTDQKLWPFRVEAGKDSKPMVVVRLFMMPFALISLCTIFHNSTPNPTAARPGAFR